MITVADPLDRLRGYDTAEAAPRLGYKPPALRAAIRRGYVRASRIGRKYIISAGEMERLLTPVGTGEQTTGE